MRHRTSVADVVTVTAILMGRGAPRTMRVPGRAGAPAGPDLAEQSTFRAGEGARLPPEQGALPTSLERVSGQ
jgi:hypothetical protein